MMKVATVVARVFATMLVLGIAVAAVAFVVEGLKEADDARAHPPPGQLVDVGGYRLHLHCTGTSVPGAPTVILEAMAGGSSPNWAWVQPEVAKAARVCSYDRAGYGWSDPRLGSMDLRRTTEDLHTLLVKAGISGPYVLVGHSMGGLIVRQFVAGHPESVVGVVLLDASHPDQFVRHPEYLEESERMMPFICLVPALARFGLMRLYVAGDGFDFGALPPQQRAELQAEWSAPKRWETQLADMSALTSIYDDARSLDDLDAIPLLVISAGTNTLPGWDALQAELSQLSTDARHVTINDATHMSLAFNPAHARQVSKEITDAVRRAQASAGEQP